MRIKFGDRCSRYLVGRGREDIEYERILSSISLILISISISVSPGGRSIHDGFATIRTGAGKRGRARSSPSVVNELRSNAPCHHGCCNTTLGRTWGMEPLWEEKGNVEQQGAQPVAKRDRAQLPWWEVATRRSKYRSCPAFSQVRATGRAC